MPVKFGTRSGIIPVMDITALITLGARAGLDY